MRGWRGGGGGRAELFTCPYPMKVQAPPPRDQRLATQYRVSGREVVAVFGSGPLSVVHSHIASIRLMINVSEQLIWRQSEHII